MALLTLCVLLTTFMPGILFAGGDSDADSEVLVADFWTAPNQGQFDFWNTKVEAFNAEKVVVNGKVVEIAIQMMPETPSSEAGIQNALATGTAPAASTNINRGFAATLASSGRIYDLEGDKLFKAITKSREMEDVLGSWEIDGGQYVIPLYANAMGYHWNVAALKALGFENDVPRTLSDIETLINNFRDLQDTRMAEMGIEHIFMRPQLMHPEWWWDRWFDFQMQYEAFSGGAAWVDGNTLALDPAVTEEVFEFYGMFGDTIQTAEDWTAFEQAEVPVVFQVCAPWDIPKYTAAGKVYGFDGDYVYGPAIVKEEGDTPYTFADSKGIAFYKGGNITDEDHEAVLAFVEWVFDGDVGVQTDIDWVKTTGMLPVRGDLTDNAAFTDTLESNPAYSYLAEVIPYAVPAMAHDKMAVIQTAFGEIGLTPYISSVMESTSISAPDSSSFVSDAFDAMKAQGELD